ncbi:hypothetical protein BC936DRAFT_141269 [Jimgerdemannia flammicorona]|uniref:Uncharacterized protein n=1 Tax=Jimgerdemannia flammicorona TaxID=994334 RepID=A0A433A2J3_9FUNG|nr:hypothetical protein BC936DRAFT_141269 [Jimgerdemannia flammicorona]
MQQISEFNTIVGDVKYQPAIPVNSGAPAAHVDGFGLDVCGAVGNVDEGEASPLVSIVRPEFVEAIVVSADMVTEFSVPLVGGIDGNDSVADGSVADGSVGNGSVDNGSVSNGSIGNGSVGDDSVGDDVAYEATLGVFEDCLGVFTSPVSKGGYQAYRRLIGARPTVVGHQSYSRTLDDIAID